MDGKMFARLIAVIAIAVAITAAAIHLAADDSSTSAQPSPPAAAAAPRTNPLRETLRRCQQMGEAASRDAGCLAAWDENRRRFLSPTAGN